MKNLLQI